MSETRLRQAEIDIAALQSEINKFKRVMRATPGDLTILTNLTLLGDKVVNMSYTTVSGVTSKITDNTATQVIAAQGAGVVIYITNILVTNGGSVGTDIEITDGSGGTVLWAGYATLAGGGFAIEFNDAPLKLTANTAVFVECEAAANISVRVSVSGYKE